MQSCMMVLCFRSNMRMILDGVNKRALQDQVSFGLTLVVHMGCSGDVCRLMVGISYLLLM